MAAAVGIKMPIKKPIGSMIIDIGGGTTDIAVISLGGVVRSKNIRNVKIAIGSVCEGTPAEAEVRGRDLITGLPREVTITDSDIKEAISQSINILIDGIKEVLETTPPEILSDVMHRGITLTGGGAMIKGIDTLLANVLKIPVKVANDPLSAVVRGTGGILEDMDYFKDILVNTQDEQAPK